MIGGGFNSSMLRVDGHNAGLPSGPERTPLEGIFQRFGKSLPCVERVSGILVISDFSSSVINGVLLNGLQTIRVRFESNARGPLEELRQFVEAIPDDFPAVALSNVRLHAKVSGRPWVEKDGAIVLLVRSFSMILPNAAQEEILP